MRFKKVNHFSFINIQYVAEWIDYFTISVSSGAPVFESFQLATIHMQDCDLKKTCIRVCSHVQLGSSFSQALTLFMKEVKCSLTKEIFEKILLCIRLGTPIARHMELLSVSLRQKALSSLEELAGQAPIKMIFPLVLFIFPAIFILLGSGALRDLLLLFL